MAAFFSTLLPCGTTMTAASPARRGGEGDALAVIAAGRRDDAGDAPAAGRFRRSHVDEAAAHLEGADRRVVLVLDPDLGARALAEQRPAILRRRRHDRMHEGGRLLKRCQRRQSRVR